MRQHLRSVPFERQSLYASKEQLRIIMTNVYAQRVESLRAIMRERGWDAVIVSGSDPHSSEYVAPRWLQVAWLAGFTGESAELVITADHAGLWTDTRYFIQAEKQLPGTGFELHKMNVPEQVPVSEWLAQYTFRSDRHIPVIAVDGLCQTVSDVQSLTDAFLAARKPAPVVVNHPDMLDLIWFDRPSVPQTPVTLLSEAYAGMTRKDKIAWLREAVQQKGCDSILLTALDEIAWLLNVRGTDIDYNPVVVSYLLVTRTEVLWFALKSSHLDDVTQSSFATLRSEGITIHPYHSLSSKLRAFDGRLYVDTSTLNYSLHEALSAQSGIAHYVSGTSPVIHRKALKNASEVEGMRRAHIVDGVAVVRFFHWLETTLARGSVVSEWDAAVRLGQFRQEIAEYRGDSFETISAWGEGAALPHYVTPKDGSTKIGTHGLYLCDSGGQYLFGTTDITRTVAVGPCTDLEKEDYTLVLQGHIRLALCSFPKGTAGCQIDVLAREPLWRTHRNFGHGTGHGVGFYLNVHEGPQNIRQGFKNEPLLPGMRTANDPGLYREGMHGIRHENLVLCVDTGARDFGRDWYAFDTITLCYFDTAPLLADRLHDDEKAWLNAYQERVYQTLAPHLTEDVATWLRQKTLPI